MTNLEPSPQVGRRARDGTRASVGHEHLDGACGAVRAWLAESDDVRPLVVTGPVGIGKTAFLQHLARRLDSGDGAETLFFAGAEEGSATPVLDRLTTGSSDDDSHSAPLVVIVDDLDILDASEQEGILKLSRVRRGARVLCSCVTCPTRTDVVELAMPTLEVDIEISVADHPELLARGAVRVFVDALRRWNPCFELDHDDHHWVAQICASSFGIPADLELLARLAHRHGLAAVHESLTEAGPRHRLAELLGDLAVEPTAANTPDEMLVLASAFAAPGGATVSMLQQALPRSDIDDATSTLVARGLIIGCADLEADPAHGSSHRFHLRPGAARAASHCAAQPEVSPAALCYARAGYLRERMRRMNAHLYDEEQRSTLRELEQELPNLRSTIVELIDADQSASAVTLMIDALPLLERSSGISELQTSLLRVIRAHEPTGTPERRRLTALAVRIFCAAGEKETASVYLEQLIEASRADRTSEGDDVEVDLLGAITTEGPVREETLTTLAACVAFYREHHDMAGLTRASAEYIPCLLSTGDFDTAAEECRTTLSEATRCGDGFAAAVTLLWRAAVSSRDAVEDARLHVERALNKLGALGPAATLRAIAVVVDNDRLRSLTQSSIDLAMVSGAISRSDLFKAGHCSGGAPAISELEHRLAGRIGSRAVRRWSSQGTSAELIEMLTEILRRRYVERRKGSVDVRTSSAPVAAADPTELGRKSDLTDRESEVAALVATGLTNRQVAGRLRISEWTAINHLRHVMGKLNCTSRVQVARWVSELETTVDAESVAI